MSDCVFCERAALREADVYIENEWCVYASSRDPTDPPDVLPGSGIVVPKAHRPSPFDFTPEEWAATHDLLLQAKAIQDERLAPDGYFLSWTAFPSSAEAVPRMHAHLHVVPRFDDEPVRNGGGEWESKATTTFAPIRLHPVTAGHCCSAVALQPERIAVVCARVPQCAPRERADGSGERGLSVRVSATQRRGHVIRAGS
jgi:diadenosine tetraphosphate (Ap4A) HIT family hydrolase